MAKLGRNDPCFCGSGKKYKHCCLGKEPSVVSATSPFPDWSHSPSLVPPPLDGFVDNPFPPELEEAWSIDSADTPLDRAFDLVADAWEVKGAERLALAQQALEESPDCIDAYNLLASEATSPEKALPFYDQALVIANRVLGPDWDRFDADYSWVDEPNIESAIDARIGFGRALLQMGRAEDAIEHIRAVLTMDPDDYDGNRCFLLDALLETNRDDEAQTWLDAYPETPSSRWPYARALLRFRRDGDTLWSRRLLVRALASNVAVAPFLLDLITPDDDSPLAALLGSDRDTSDAGQNLHNAWQQTPDAIEWLRGIYEAGPDAGSDAGPRGDGPTFCVSPSDSMGYIHCPRCKAKTKPRKREIVVLVEPDELISARVACRHCESCDVLSVLTQDLEKGFKNVMRRHGVDRERRDFIPLGIVDTNDMTARPEGPAEATWLEDHVLRWRDEISVLPSAVPELDRLMSGYDLDDDGLYDDPEPVGVIDVPFSVTRQ